MAFKGFKKSDQSGQVNHFDEVARKESDRSLGRPSVDDYKKQDQRIQFYVSQELIDLLAPIALQNGCKDVTAYAKKILVNEFNNVKDSK